MQLSEGPRHTDIITENRCVVYSLFIVAPIVGGGLY